MKRSKRYTSSRKLVDDKKVYDAADAVSAIKKGATAKFDESFEVSMWLGVDPRKADQVVRGTVSLPHGTGKSVRVLVFARSPLDQKALEAGADYAGLDEYVEKVQSGWTDVDVVIASPDTMGQVGKLGRILGPRGLMPNPKSGTVTPDVVKAIGEVKAGKIEYRVDKGGNIHAAIGKCSFSEAQLKENLEVFVASILRSKPSAAKGKYIKSIHFSSTMGPSVEVSESSLS